MKRTELIKRLRRIAKDSDLVFGELREGAEHTLFLVGNQEIAVPRHREINEYTAKGILKAAKNQEAPKKESDK